MVAKFCGDIEGVDWKGIFAERHCIDRSISRAIDSILSSQMGRVDKVQTIIEYGYDAKDCLIRHLRVDEGAEDALARR
jgi:F-box protein 21